MIAPIFPLYALNVGATLVEVGLLLSVLSFVTMMVRIPFGTAGKSLGPERLMLVSCSLYVVSLVLYYLASSVLWILVAVVLNGLATGSFGPLAASTVLNLADPETRGNVSGKYYFSIGLAMFLGPFITCSNLVSGLQIILSCHTHFPALVYSANCEVEGKSQGWGLQIQFSRERRN